LLINRYYQREYRLAQQTFVIIYGSGGHQEEMSRLLNYDIFTDSDDIQLIAFTDSMSPIDYKGVKNYQFSEFRDKHSNKVTLLNMPWNLVKLISFSLAVLKNNNIKGCVTTGPGLAIVPTIIFHLFGKKTVVFESWAKFYKPTMTAKILYYFSGLFIVQHQSMKKVFPKAKYWGRL